MSKAVSPSCIKPYGLARVCRVWAVSRATVYRRASASASEAPRVLGRRGPKTAWTDEQLTTLIREDLASSPWVGEGHRKVWARLRSKDVRTSLRRTLRLMREAELLAPHRNLTGRSITGFHRGDPARAGVLGARRAAQVASAGESGVLSVWCARYQ